MLHNSLLEQLDFSKATNRPNCQAAKDVVEQGSIVTASVLYLTVLEPFTSTDMNNPWYCDSWPAGIWCPQWRDYQLRLGLIDNFPKLIISGCFRQHLSCWNNRNGLNWQKLMTLLDLFEIYADRVEYCLHEQANITLVDWTLIDLCWTSFHREERGNLSLDQSGPSSTSPARRLRKWDHGPEAWDRWNHARTFMEIILELIFRPTHSILSCSWDFLPSMKLWLWFITLGTNFPGCFLEFRRRLASTSFHRCGSSPAGHPTHTSNLSRSLVEFRKLITLGNVASLADELFREERVILFGFES